MPAVEATIEHNAGVGADPTVKDGGGGVDKVYGFRPKTTWQLKPPRERTLWEFIASRDLCPQVTYQKRPTTAPLRGPPPTRSMFMENLFIIRTAAFPLLVHTAWNYFVPEHKMHWAPAWAMYHLSFIGFAIFMIERLHHAMETLGTFDEQNRGRDMVDDAHVNHLGRSIFIYTVFRTIAPFAISWRGAMTNPWEGLSLWSPVKIALFEVALDYFFYLYHRSTHEFDSLWWIHHDVQECIEIFCVPFLATLVAPQLTFVEMWFAINYLLYVEALGHSGIRAYWPHPILGQVLKPFGMELAVEDHDLHHRFGKSGKNYGKQTRIFDRIFGTVGERLECTQGH